MVYIVRIIVNGYIFKKDDKELKNKQRLIPVLNKIFKQNPSKYTQLELDKITDSFNKRLKTSRKENIKCLICITHNPYDVAGMSTDRNWTSCMNLDTGKYKKTPLLQVQYGRYVCIFN
jgi:type IV secretory pathway VirB4 component